MLAKLIVKNYAIIDQLELDWPGGLIAITGETGAGKSIIIGALQFVLGGRTESKVMRNSDEKCIVEVRFNQLQDKFEELKAVEYLDAFDEIIIRREINPNGRSRSFVNDSQVNVSELLQLSPILINIHQQFDHLDILEEETQLALLDLYAGLGPEVLEYQEQFKLYKKRIAEKSQLEEEQKKSNQERDYIEFQLQELLQTNLQAEEYNQLENELALALSAEEILNSAQGSTQILEGDKGVIDQLQEIANLLKPIQHIPSILEIYSKIQDIKSDCKDVHFDLNKMADQTEFDAEKINLLQSRFDHLTRLFKKHQVQTDVELISIREKLSEKIKTYNSLEQDIEILVKQISEIRNTLTIKAQKISVERKLFAAQIKPDVVQLLQRLGMEYAQFSIEINASQELQWNGMDKVEYLFSANKGTSLRPIRQQSSGGELSRLNLALKSLSSKKSKLPTMIFDEIDTGVSGQIALQMGDILKEMSLKQQLITITHSPQVASRAAHQFLVYKDTNAAVTNSRMKKLNKEERMIELAKMLSGDPPTASAIKNANDLISSAN